MTATLTGRFSVYISPVGGDGDGELIIRVEFVSRITFLKAHVSRVVPIIEQDGLHSAADIRCLDVVAAKWQVTVRGSHQTQAHLAHLHALSAVARHRHHTQRQ